MSEDPRFVCRREGHVSSGAIKAPKGTVVSFVFPCARCGQPVEWLPDGTERERRAAS